MSAHYARYMLGTKRNIISSSNRVTLNDLKKVKSSSIVYEICNLLTESGNKHMKEIEFICKNCRYYDDDFNCCCNKDGRNQNSDIILKENICNHWQRKGENHG